MKESDVLGSDLKGVGSRCVLVGRKSKGNARKCDGGVNK